MHPRDALTGGRRPAPQRPIELGVDLVIQSTTKFYDGHNITVGGAVISNDMGVMATVLTNGSLVKLAGPPPATDLSFTQVFKSAIVLNSCLVKCGARCPPPCLHWRARTPARPGTTS